MCSRGHLILVVLAALAVTALLVVGGSRVSARFAELSTAVNALSVLTISLEERVAEIADDAEALRGTLSLEQQERLREAAAERKEREELAAQFETLSTDVSDQSLLFKAADLAGVIARWNSYVYKLACTFRAGTSAEEVAGGSAIVEVDGTGARFVTNEHVLEDGGDYPDSCVLLIPGTKTDILVDGEALAIETGRDVGYGTIHTPGISGIPPAQHCAGKPEIGDGVVILGYPTIGGEESVTATEGIISGFDGKFYTTSAKIEKGNSGGAAIDVKRDCLLGLPTLVIAGRIESLARILPL